tara:strand:- start:351 stop:671 length:321 start_codon:yes stop_codon:yes gene_type:complete
MPFNLDFYKEAQNLGLSANHVFENKEKYFIKKTKYLRNEYDIETEFIWLITVGLLRREVDGQGLTSKVRLTPLGRQIIEKSPEIANMKSFIFQRISHWIYRKLKLK